MLQMMYRLLCLWIVSLLIVLAQPAPCTAKMISVELVWNLSQAGWIQVDIDKGDYLLKLGNESYKFSAGSTLQVGWGGWTPVLRINHEEFRVVDGSLLDIIALNSGSLRIKTPEGKAASYRGGLQLNWQDGHWRLINQVDSEDYLKGVVPIEMSNEWANGGLEALKAQAVAARTYLVRQLSNGKLITDSPDIHQAYSGLSVEGEASQAIEATRGEILVDAQTKQPIDALYSSHSGGHTEDAKNVWGNADLHNISHPDPYSKGVGGAVNHWRFIVSAPLLGSTFGLGPVREIELDKFPSGRVKSVKLEDEFGQTTIVKGRAFVQAFYPFGQPIRKEAFLGNLFEAKTVVSNRSLSEKSISDGPFNSAGYSGFLDLTKQPEQEQGPLLSKILSSSLGTNTNPQPYAVFIFEGQGWGHGVGMSQWGAYHMAQLGFKYQEILTYYYNNVLISKV
ncbi:SpoIID/LytB domain-containing protein [Desulfosporosinus hippei]|uniref:Stage II sporulation protein D n=1 Tax=Desulfosporosinus hippei DSM 8344 TaxID=1121419 RepID=A0A1G8GHU0_9FIRM|nr:SpoIID/LytB domain-containing protein [Desulfosporosinus hippei]SDH93979.1 stage II sporulation protein D [Desulfosporosinus hippei DSM 8344]